MSDNYWQSLVSQRLSRRRALVVAGGGSAAAFLAACGGGSSGGGGKDAAPSGPKDASGLLAQVVDTSGSAVRGDTLKSLASADVTSFDPLTSQSFTTQVHAGFLYSRILKVVPGFKGPSKRDLEGDLAESWEVSPDKLTITLKLRKNAKWDAQAPTSGRAVAADDIVWSWNRFAAASPYRADMSYKANPDAAIDSMTAPDANTLVVKLAAPDASALTMLGSSAHLFILPKEAEGGFDPRNTVRGSGPWTVEKYQQSVGFTYAKNPNWYRSDRPLADKIEMPIVSEYSQQLAQFRAGNVQYFAITGQQAGVQQQDVLQTKKDVPDLNLVIGEYATSWFNSWFGYQGNSPFKDQRVRQAISMSYDRDAYIEAIFNTADFKKTGLPVDTRWHSHLTAGLDGWWLDPKDDKAFGPNNQYFKQNLAEAKKLLAAAGYNGQEVPAAYISTSQYGTVFPNMCQIQVGFMNEAGIKTKIANPDYQTVWLNNYYYGKGNFEGIAVGADSTEADVGTFYFARSHPKGPRFKGFSPDGSNPANGDPEMTKMIEDVRKEFDTEKRRDIAKRFQQYAAKSMYMVPFPGLAAPFVLRWPSIGNGGVFIVGSQYGGGTETIINNWVDKTKAPFKK
jgi:peptide/nickel transport system substrate-binding protein